MNEGTAEGHAIDGVLVDRTAQLVPGFLDLTNDRDVVLADVNGDGWNDIVTAVTLGGLSAPKEITHPRVYINQGTDWKWLGFVFDDVDRIPTFPYEPRFNGVAAGDIDNDGDVDLYFADSDQGPYSRGGDLNDRLLANDGTGYFLDVTSTALTSQMAASSLSSSVQFADMNGDGWPDIVKNENGPSTDIFYNAGDGTFDDLDQVYFGSLHRPRRAARLRRGRHGGHRRPACAPCQLGALRIGSAQRPRKEQAMSTRSTHVTGALSALVVPWLLVGGAAAGDDQERPSSYGPVVIAESFESIMERMKAAKPQVMRRQRQLLEDRYDLADRPAPGATMSRGKPVQVGVRVRLEGVTWEALAGMTPQDIREQGLFPDGFLPLPHPNHPEGGMVFPTFHIEEIRRQTGRDLTRFDLEFDLPDHILPEFPPPIYLTTRPDLGDVSQGKLVTTDNYYELFNGILNPKQLEGLRLLVTPFPQQQFNATEDRRSERSSLGVSCFECHVNGHTNAATHLVGDIRPQEFRHRIDTPSLRGVNIQRLFGSQRALRSVEDFTEFEQRAAYFDGDPVLAQKKGANVLDRGSQVHFMAEFQELLDFPPAPKLDVLGRLDPGKATPQELQGEVLFFGKAKCSQCHAPPYYTDNLMHNLRTEQFFYPQMINGRMAAGDGPIKTFPLRGIKDSPPYLHDGRLLTMEDTVEFFNLILGTKLTRQEKEALVAFLRTL
jgi:cytochrome c peroxidase